MLQVHKIFWNKQSTDCPSLSISISSWIDECARSTNDHILTCIGTSMRNETHQLARRLKIDESIFFLCTPFVFQHSFTSINWFFSLSTVSQLTASIKLRALEGFLLGCTFLFSRETDTSPLVMSKKPATNVTIVDPRKSREQKSKPTDKRNTGNGWVLVWSVRY